jgi:peptidylprolyl isomerase
MKLIIIVLSIMALSLFFLVFKGFSGDSAPPAIAQEPSAEVSTSPTDPVAEMLAIVRDASTDWVETESGLKYVDLVQGNEANPQIAQNITVHYRGILKNGKPFDSSYDRNRPFEFRLGVGQVIKGWDEGFSGMGIGGKRLLVIPPELGYGSRKVGPIPENSTLIFEVELLKIAS